MKLNKSYDFIYSIDDCDNGLSSIINETSITGYTVVDNLKPEDATILTELLNDLYNQLKKDILEHLGD